MKSRKPHIACSTVLRFVLLVVAALGGFPCQAQQVRGAWRAQRDGDTPARILAEAQAGQLAAFDPGRMQLFVTKPTGSWIVLWPDATAPRPQVLTMPWPTMARASLFDAAGHLLASTDSQAQDSGLPGYGRLALPLPDAPAGTPLLLQFRQSANFQVPVTLHLQTLHQYQHANARWLAMASACFGVMLAMAVLALCFSLLLRDLTFAWYAGYVVSFVMIQLIQSGYLYQPLGWTPVLGGDLPLAVGAVMAAMLFVTLFMRSFCDMDVRAPRLRPVLFATMALAMAAMVLHVLPLPLLAGTVQPIANPLVALWTLAVLGGAATCALRGSRTAWFFLAGWTPLLVLVALTNAQNRGHVLPSVDWLHNACLVAAALESLVLSVGLADRALSMRRDRDRARALADLDALTGLLNRRAWAELADARLMAEPAGSQVLLFLDLDHFKTLNDHFGHVAGDSALLSLAHALRSELGSGDLIGRLGGEEFVALIGERSRDEAMHVAARLCRRVGNLDIPLNDAGALLTVSIGVARQRPSDTLATLVERADAAMYAAKASGRNRAMWESAVRQGAPQLHVVPQPPASRPRD